MTRRARPPGDARARRRTRTRRRRSAFGPTFFVVAPDAAELAHLAGLVDDGKLRPVLSQTFPLRDGRKAFESATVPHPPGKTVLIVG